MGKWQILYLRTRYRSKLGWFFWFGPIHVTIHRNLLEKVFGKSYSLENSLQVSIFREDLFLYNWLQIKAAKDSALGSEGNHDVREAASSGSSRRGYVMPRRINFGTYRPTNPAWESRDQLYKDRSSRKIDSRRQFSRE